MLVVYDPAGSLIERAAQVTNLFWYVWGLIAAGVADVAYAIALGLRELGRLAWRWDAPLRTLERPQSLACSDQMRMLDSER